MQAVISSAFESSIGLAQLAQLAAAVDSTADGSSSAHGTAAAPSAHGLGTADWFTADVVQPSRTLSHAPSLAVNDLDQLVRSFAQGQGQNAAVLGGQWEPSGAVVTHCRQRLRTEAGTVVECDFALTSLHVNTRAPATQGELDVLVLQIAHVLSLDTRVTEEINPCRAYCCL